MAFCKFCGKQIPDGGSCDCSAAKAAAEAGEKVENAAEAVKTEAAQAVDTATEQAVNVAQTIQNDAAQAAQTVQNGAAQAAQNVEQAASNAQQQANNAANQAGNGFKQLSGADIAKKVEGITNSINDKLPENVKKNKTLVFAGAGAALFLIIILLFACLAGGGYKSAVKKYVNSQADKKGGKTYMSLTIPKSAIKAIKEDDDYDDMIDDFNDNVEDKIDDLEDEETLPKFDKFLKSEKLKKSQIKLCEKYFEFLLDEYDADDDEVKIIKGYEVKFKTVEKDEDGKEDHNKEAVCVVKLRGDGWKVIEADADDLKWLS